MENITATTLKPIKTTLILGAVWDSIGGIIFLVIHGFIQKELVPDIYPFYSMVIGLFLFTLAYIQILTVSNISKFLQNVGVVIFLRLSFGSFLVLHSVIFEPLPAQFIAIACVDALFSISQFTIIGRSKDYRIKDIFLPS